MQIRSIVALAGVLALTGALLIGCPSGDGGEPARSVTIYCSADQVYSSKILADFEERTGIRVDAKYDAESTKTTGLVNALLAERERPRCDVFWSNEVAQTAFLAEEGVLQPYLAEAATAIPAAFRDPDGRWHGFAPRLRVLLVNTDLVAEADMPSSVEALRDERWKDRIAIARPLYGTTATWAAAMFVTRGDDEARKLFADILANGALVAAGNAHVKERVVAGDVAIGFTDSDDAEVAVRDGKPVKVIIPDQGADGAGTLLIPNSVALVDGAPHAEEGQALVEFLLSEEVEAKLASGRSAQIPVRKGIAGPESYPAIDEIRVLEVDWSEVGRRLREVSAELKESFVGG